MTSGTSKRKTQSAPTRMEIPDRIPLAQNKEFKSIKNAIIKEALKLNITEDEEEERE